MNEPRQPISHEAFNDAADAAEAWRQQQTAALTDMQRQLYEQACRKSKEREDAKAKELERRRQAAVQERMRNKLLEQRNLQFNFRGRRTRMTEDVARRLIEEHSQPGRPPDHSLFAATLQRLEQVAIAEVQRDHALQLKAFKDQERAGLDTMLRRFEQARESKDQGRQDFARAGIKGKAKTDFTQRVKDRLRQTQKQREEERNRGKDRDGGRER